MPQQKKDGGQDEQNTRLVKKWCRKTIEPEPIRSAVIQESRLTRMRSRSRMRTICRKKMHGKHIILKAAYCKDNQKRGGISRLF